MLGFAIFLVYFLVFYQVDTRINIVKIGQYHQFPRSVINLCVAFLPRNPPSSRFTPSRLSALKDGGETFKFNPDAKDIPGNLYRVKFFGADGYALGSDGVLLKYTAQMLWQYKYRVHREHKQNTFAETTYICFIYSIHIM